MECIFCGETDVRKFNTVEHIVSESLGNKLYTLQKGDLCDDCQNRFSEFEAKALSASVIGMERAAIAIQTKKKKPVSVSVKSSGIPIKVVGDKNYRERYVNIVADQHVPITNYDPEKRQFNMVIDGPDESQGVAISKLLLKIGVEAMFQTQGEVYDEYGFSNAKNYLLGKTNRVWPFIMPSKFTPYFIDVLQHDPALRKHLSDGRLKIEYRETKAGEVLFKLTIGGIRFIINLVDNSPNWILPYITSKATDKYIHPTSLRPSFEKRFNL